MNIAELVLKNRSYRRFHEDEPIEDPALKNLVDLARLSASGSNLQALKFFILSDPKGNAEIFPHLQWAGYLKDWSGPSKGERPSAYIIIFGDKNIRENFGFDPGIAAQSILLGATELGLGGCMIGSINKKGIREVLNIQDHLDILLVIALGIPKEKIVIENVGSEGDIKYWRDDDGVHHVPKRKLDEIILNRW